MLHEEIQLMHLHNLNSVNAQKFPHMNFDRFFALLILKMAHTEAREER